MTGAWGVVNHGTVSLSFSVNAATPSLFLIIYLIFQGWGAPGAWVLSHSCESIAHSGKKLSSNESSPASIWSIDVSFFWTGPTDEKLAMSKYHLSCLEAGPEKTMVKCGHVVSLPTLPALLIYRLQWTNNNKKNVFPVHYVAYLCSSLITSKLGDSSGELQKSLSLCPH